MSTDNAVFSGVTLISMLLKFLGAICVTLERNMFVMLATWSCQTFYAMWHVIKGDCHTDFRRQNSAEKSLMSHFAC